MTDCRTMGRRYFAESVTGASSSVAGTWKYRE